MMNGLLFRRLLTAGLLAIYSLGCNGSVGGQDIHPTNLRTADEQAIRSVIDRFQQTFNAKDAHSLAELFTKQAEITSAEGETARGRENIEKVFRRIFAEEPKAAMTIHVQSIRLIGENTAVEEGTTKVTTAPGAESGTSRYVVIHVKEEGKWLIASARDQAGGPELASSRLQQLEWLLGDWIDESPAAVVRTSFKWSENKRFILGEFHVQTAGRPALSGTQRIGWDPAAAQLRSWVFDGQGGFASGLWSQAGNQWMVKLSSTLPDGKAASATNSFRREGKDRILFSSRDRVVAGEALPDITALPMVRKPPQPAGK